MLSNIGGKEAHFFAALTMQNKLRYDFAELPRDSLPALRSSIMQHLLRLSSAPRAIVTKLCLAVSALAVQMEEWQNVIPQLVNMFIDQHSTLLRAGLAPDSSLVTCLLELLAVIPQDCFDDQVSSSSNPLRA